MRFSDYETNKSEYIRENGDFFFLVKRVDLNPNKPAILVGLVQTYPFFISSKNPF